MKSLDELVLSFANNVIGHTDAIERGDAEAASRHGKKYLRAFMQLRIVGDTGREALSKLFKHERSDVRVMAAAFLLKYNNEEAKRVLKAEASKKGLIAFEAGECLKRWDEGVWALDE